MVTLIKGRHILHFGGELLDFRDNSTPWGNINAATMTFSGAFTRSGYNVTTTGLGYADFLLGTVANWSAGYHADHWRPAEGPAGVRSGRLQSCAQT